MTRSTAARLRPRLALQPLEDRMAPAIGLYTEDFSDDYNANRPEYDTGRDGVRIRAEVVTHLPNATDSPFAPTPAGGPAGKHSLRLKADASLPDGQAVYAGQVNRSTAVGDLRQLEQLAEAEVAVLGNGTVTFVGANGEATFATSAFDQWGTFRVTRETVAGNGQPLGPIERFTVTNGDVGRELLVDNVKVRVMLDPVRTFAEDFSNDANANRGGYDTGKDGLHIRMWTEEFDWAGSTYTDGTVGAEFVPTPAGGPAGKHSLQLSPSAASPTGDGFYQADIRHSSAVGDLPPWDQVVGAEITIRGQGNVLFDGLNGTVSFAHRGPADQWVTFRAAADTVVNGRLLGPIQRVRVMTIFENSVMLVDDLKVQVKTDPDQLQDQSGEGPEVRVNLMGAMAIVGTARDEAVRIEIAHDELVYDLDQNLISGGTVRIIGLGGTRISVSGSSPFVTQLSPYAVEIIGFAHVQSWDGYDRPQKSEADILVNLNGGDDVLHVVGGVWGPGSTTIDDLIVNMGQGESFVEIEDLKVWDALSVNGGSQKDRVQIGGATNMRALGVHTRGGDDVVRIGSGNQVRLRNGAFWDDYQQDALRRSVVSTGAGHDVVDVRNMEYDHLLFDLGAGLDALNLLDMSNSPVVGSLAVWTGPGRSEDRVELRRTDSKMFDLTSKRGDVLRLDEVRFDDARLRGQFGLAVELPASGTTVHNGTSGTNETTLTPTTPLTEVWEAIADLLNAGTPSQGINKSRIWFISFTPFADLE